MRNFLLASLAVLCGASLLGSSVALGKTVMMSNANVGMTYAKQKK